MSYLLLYSFETNSENFAIKPCVLPIIARAPSVQMVRNFFKFNLLQMQAFLTDTNMSSPRELEKSVSAERRSLQTSKLEKKEMKKTSCA